MLLLRFGWPPKSPEDYAITLMQRGISIFDHQVQNISVSSFAIEGSPNWLQALS